jgi:hypothetical protein
MKTPRLRSVIAAWLIITASSLGPAQAGTLSATFTSLNDLTAPVDLTAEGVTDWAYWGLSTVTDFDQKAGVANQISNYTLRGSRDALWYNNSTTLFSWSDGAPDPAATATPTGIYFPGVNDGYEVDVAADTTPRLLNIYVGAWAGRIHFEAALSDGSAPTYIDETFSHDTSGGANRRYSIIFAANSAGQTLKIRAWVISTVDVNGNVTLQAATLQPLPPLSVTDPAASPTNTVASGTLVTLSVVASGAFPYYYQWLVDSGSGFDSVPNSNTNALAVNTTNLKGTYNYEVIVTNSSGGAITSAPITLTVTVPNGVLQVSSDDLVGVTEVNLSTEGTLDWAHWGLTTATDFDQKAGVTSQISNYLPVGTSLDYNQYGNNAQGFTWTDGTPTSSADQTTTGIYVIGQGNGFEVDVQAQQTNLWFNIYVGVYTPGGNLASLHLEASLSDNSAPAFVDESLSGSANRRYSMIFAAGLPNQTLKIRYWVVGAADGNVTLQAATLKTVPPLTVSQPVIWPTNVLAVGSTVKLSSQVQGPFPYFYQWQVNSSGRFVGIPDANTNSVYVTPPASGTYNYRVVVTNNSAQATTSPPVTLTVTAATSTLAVTSRDVQAFETIDLTAEGTLDWAHWGLNTSTDFDQKSSVVSQISNYSPVGTAATTDYYQYSNNGLGFTWSDGTPDLTADSSTTGIYVAGVGNGYQVQVPAALTPRVLKMYVGAWQATAHFEASLSDNTAPIYFDESFTAQGSQNRVYTITYAAPSAGPNLPNLAVSYWMIGGAGNVTLNTASLAAAVILSLHPAAGGQLQLSWPQGILLEASSLSGPWLTHGNASPYTFSPIGPQQFFRVRVQ